MKQARFLVSFELLRQVLNLPPETEIQFVSTAQFQEAEFIVTHPALKDSDADMPPLILPSFRREYQSVAVFAGWGQE